MQTLRTSVIRSMFTLLAGLAFTNLSFVLAELKSLRLSDSALYETLLNTGLEEETEKGESGEADNSFKEKIELAASENLLHHQMQTSNASQRNKAFINLTVEPGYRRKFSPPPEFA